MLTRAMLLRAFHDGDESSNRRARHAESKEGIKARNAPPRTTSRRHFRGKVAAACHLQERNLVLLLLLHQVL